MARTKTEEPTSTEDFSKKQLATILKAKKDEHLNFHKTIYYRASLGSLMFDYETGGGLTPGLHRFCGSSESGKSSSALTSCSIFLQTPIPEIPRKGFLIKAEGRLDPDLQKRFDTKFVFSADEWNPGTCFVLETNVYETAFSTIRELIDNNVENCQYFFIIDSMDALCRKDDLAKGFYDTTQPAAGAKLTSEFGQKIALKMAKFGHICILISQMRDSIKIDPYAKVIPKMSSVKGGHAPFHYSNFVFEFAGKSQSSLILENPSQPLSDKNRPIGHTVKVKIAKSTNEKTFLTVTYPVKYFQTGRNSIWVEREIADLLKAFGLITREKGAWWQVSEQMVELLKNEGIDCPEKLQGDPGIYQFLETNPKAVSCLYSYLSNLISS